MTAASIISVFSSTGPPKACEKCKGARFEWMEWVNRGGTTEPAYCCRGCGRVYEPVEVDWATVMNEAFRHAATAGSAMRDAIASGVQAFSALEEFTAPRPRRDPHRRENWKAMEKRHARRHAGKKR